MHRRAIPGSAKQKEVSIGCTGEHGHDTAAESNTLSDLWGACGLQPADLIGRKHDSRMFDMHCGVTDKSHCHPGPSGSMLMRQCSKTVSCQLDEKSHASIIEHVCMSHDLRNGIQYKHPGAYRQPCRIMLESLNSFLHAKWKAIPT